MTITNSLPQLMTVSVYVEFALQPARGTLLLAKYLAVAAFALGIVLAISVVAVAVAAVVSAVQGTGLRKRNWLCFGCSVGLSAPVHATGHRVHSFPVVHL